MTVRHLAFAILLALLAFGCWRTRLTEPKEAVLYYDEEGRPQRPGVVIRAPDYMAMVRRLRAERGEEALEEYRIKPNHRLRVEVVGVEDLDRTIDVGPDGRISLPLIGQVMAEGKTMTELHRELEEKYARYYRDPQVIVNTVSTQLTAAEFGGIPQAGSVSVFSVTGRTGTTVFGQYRAGGVVNLRGDERVTHALAKTHAISGESEWRQIAIIREPREGLKGVIIVDLERFFKYGATDEDIPLRDGDVIFVPIERNTWVEELFANVRVLGTIGASLGEVADFVSTSEGIGD